MTDAGSNEYERQVLIELPLVYLPLGETHHVAWVWDGGSMVRHVDGERVDP